MTFKFYFYFSCSFLVLRCLAMYFWLAWNALIDLESKQYYRLRLWVTGMCHCPDLFCVNEF